MSITWHGDRPHADSATAKPRSLEVEFTVRWKDLFSMYLAPLGARLTVLPGLLFLALLYVGSSPSDAGSSNLGILVVVGIVSTVAGPIIVCVLGSFFYGSYRAVGLAVRLQIDDDGVQGWPVAPAFDRRWDRIHNVMKFASVMTLPFGGAAARYGWVPLPDRALTLEGRAQLEPLLQGLALLRQTDQPT